MFGVCFSQFGHSTVQHFLGQAPRQCFKYFFGVFTLGQHFAGTGHFSFSPLIGLGIQLLNEWHAAALNHPVHEALHAGVNDDLGFCHRGLPMGLASLNDTGQIVDGVEINIFQGFHFGLDVSRDRQVDHEHRAVAPFLECTFDGPQANERQGAGCAADDSIKFMQAIGQFGQAHDLGAKLSCQLFAAIHAAVGNGHAARIFGGKVSDHQFNHLTRTHKQHFDFAEVFKKLACQSHRRGRHADGMSANFGGRAHFLGNCKTSLKQLIQGAAQGASFFGGPDSIFQLTQNLGFTQDHGVEPAGNPEGMARHMAFF